MIFYRLVTGRYASETWTGSGANQHGGRWNHQGHPADAPLHRAGRISGAGAGVCPVRRPLSAPVAWPEHC
ncbi:hypothetical protein [Klebsiella electrica]|uniref:hypothetical protein n=1 Tax=Klebsiella electrica TaxID=1259973 RepID=UPI003F77333D